MPSSAADRNLLLGILAVQNGFVPRDALFDAMLAWTARKDSSLGTLLVERGELAKNRCDLLEMLVEEHIKAHGGDPARSLLSVSSVGSVADDLANIADPDIQASVAYVRSMTSTKPDDPDATRAPSAFGEPTSWNGRFRVVRPHASGGLGVVSVAIDDELDREVAFKEIRDQFADSDSKRSRFVLEAEITGKLEHPGIIPIYGLGHDPMGRPFYAMRFIKGDSLADAINHFHDPNGKYTNPSERSSQLRELLGRFLDVCDAMAYAHSRGVLHRDLKPGNIMLGPFGETLVVDWGLALPLERVPEGHESTQGAVKPTKVDSGSLIREQGQVIGTPAYMSPEQAEGLIDKLGPRSDVYGLGAILYELLTGKYPTEGSSIEETLKHVREGRIQPPRQVRPEISKSLEAICLKALALKPEDRYVSPKLLAMDIKKWLADDPVSAMKEPLAEKARRWAKRNRTIVAGVAASLLVGLIGVGAVAGVQTKARNDLAQKNKALDEQRQRAEKNEAEAIAAVKKFGEVIANEPELKNNPTLEPLRKRLLNEPLAFFKSLRERLLADSDTRPESLARLADVCSDLGHLTSEIGNKQDALKAYQESLVIDQKLADTNSFDTQFQNHLASSHNSIAKLMNATGRPVEALKAYESALSIFQKLTETNPAVTQFHSGLAASHNNIGTLLNASGRPNEALKAYEAALAIFQRLADANPANTQFRSDLATCQKNIGAVLNATGRPVEALRAYESALSIFQKLTDTNPVVTEFQRGLATSHINIGGLLSASGRPVEALRAYESALKIHQKLADANPSVTEFQSDVARGHNNIGALLSATGRPVEALRAYESALEIRQKLADANPSVAEFQSDVAFSLDNIGGLLSDTGRPVEALKAYESALKIHQKLANANPSITELQQRLAMSHNHFGILLNEAGRWPEALRAYESALAIFQKLADANPSVTRFQTGLAGSHGSIGNLLRGYGRPVEALKAYQAALEIYLKLTEANPFVTEFQSGLAASHINIGNLLSGASRSSEALKSYESALSILQKLVDANPSLTRFQELLASSHSSIGNLLNITGHPAEALIACDSSLTIFRKMAHDHPASLKFASDLGVSLNNRAMIDLDAKRFEKACVHLREAVTWQQKALAGNPANPIYRRFLANHLINLIQASQGLGDANGVAEAERELAALKDSDPAILALDRRLASILKGQYQIKNNAERLQLAQRAYDKALHANSAKLWAEAFLADPQAAESRNPQNRYNGACASALAGCGLGKDESAPDETAKIGLRGQALGWLQAEVTAWSLIVESGPAPARPFVVQTLQHWKIDSDLAGVRDLKALDGLPEGERSAWKDLWAQVDRLIEKASKP